MNRIGLEGMEFHSAIGYYSQERLARGRFTVDATIDVDTKKAAESDDLKATVNYEEIHHICSHFMNKEYDLIETVAYDIALAIKKKWVNIKVVWIRVSKWNPPLAGSTKRTFTEIKI